MPALEQARQSSRLMVCGGQLRQVAAYAAMYVHDHTYPPYFRVRRTDGYSGIFDYVNYNDHATLWPQGPYPGMNAMMEQYMSAPRTVMKCSNLGRLRATQAATEVKPYDSFAGLMHSPWERWRPNHGNTLALGPANPRPKIPSKFFVLGCRSDYPPPYVPDTRCLNPESGHPPGQQEGIETLWLDGHAEYLPRDKSCIAHLYGACDYGQLTAGSSDGYMVPEGYTTTW